MNETGAAAIFMAWAIHDIEEAVALPATCDELARTTGFEQLRMDRRQSWLSVSLMGVLVGFACRRGTITEGRSLLYRATIAGLEAHVGTHIMASLLRRGYTAGVVTAVLFMWPGARHARCAVDRMGVPLTIRDYTTGACLLIPAALTCHIMSRLLLRRA